MLIKTCCESDTSKKNPLEYQPPLDKFVLVLLRLALLVIYHDLAL